jgi:glucose-1-phosphatase
VPAGKLRAVIFDIGRVLIRIDLAGALGGLATSLSMSPPELWAAIEKDPKWKDWQEGRISPRDWHLHMNQRFGTSMGFEQFAETWNRVLDPKPLQPDSLFEGLSKNYRLALLSNTDPIHVAHMEANFSFLRFFKVRIYSCGVRASKPNPLIYREALKGCKVEAGEALYIDDIAAYVEAAQRLGMDGIRYQSPEQLARDLEGHGVKLS